MKTTYRILCVLCITLICMACGNDDDDCSGTRTTPPPNWFELGFVDSEGMHLIGTTYPQESFRLFNDNEDLLLTPFSNGAQSRLIVSYPDITSGTEYYLEFTETDNDTLIFNYNVNDGGCFNSYILEELIYNGEIIDVNNSNQIDLLK